MNDQPTPMQGTMVNGRWMLLLPLHRALRPEWPWWEATRLAAEHHVISGLAADWRRSGVVVMDRVLTEDEVRHIYEAWTADPVGNQTPAVVGVPRPPEPRRPVVWVAGAEEGDFPALYSKWGADVVLAEPNPLVWPNIKAIWDANNLRPPLATWAGFLGDELRGWVTVWDGDGWPLSADGPVIGDHGFRRHEEHVDIPIVTIDALVAAGTPPPDVLTIDVEGAEAHVLRGAVTTLRNHRPLVFVSVHDEFALHHYGDTDVLGSCVEVLAAAGYLIDGDHEHRLCHDHEEHWWWAP